MNIGVCQLIFWINLLVFVVHWMPAFVFQALICYSKRVDYHKVAKIGFRNALFLSLLNNQEMSLECFLQLELLVKHT